MKGQLSIDTIYAYIIRDEDGTEGIIGHVVPGSGSMPLIGADEERMRSMEPIAQAIADGTGKTISLVHFTKREELKPIEPNRTSKTKVVRLGGPDSNLAGIL